MKTYAKLKKIISAVLSAALIAPAFAVPAHAEKTDEYIPEIEMTEDILSSDVFYLTAANARLEEGANKRYLLRIARGGDCASESGVTVKISDLTAKYGKDYTVSVYGGEEAYNPDGNQSLIERMEGEEYTESELKTEEEYAEMLKNDEELQKATEQGVQKAIDYIEEQSGLLSAGQAEEAADGDGETLSVSPLQRARAAYTGVEGAPQAVTSTTDTVQQIQQMANVVTNVVVGATLTVGFAEGEKEKYIAIDVDNNDEGDGDRLFFFMLANPYGTTTNSASSSCAFTIADDEVQAPSKVGFTEETYSAEGDSFTVEIKREGALNTIAAAHLTTADGSARTGRDFSPVDMDVVFPIGIDTRRIEIPIRGDYIAGEADFKLKLEESEMCEITTPEAAVTIKGTLGTSDSDISLSAIEESGRVSDIVLGDPIDISKSSGGYISLNSQAMFSRSMCSDNLWKGDYWLSRWVDGANTWAHIFDPVKENFWGWVKTEWRYADASRAVAWDIAGVQVDWWKPNKCATITAQMGTRANEPWTENPLRESLVFERKDRIFEDHSEGNRVKTNMFVTGDGAVSPTVYIGNHGQCTNCDQLRIYGITPICRPFVINLQSADALTFLNSDGTSSPWQSPTFLALAGSDNTNNNQIIRYTKDGKNSIAFQQTLGGNVTSPYVYLKNVYAVKNGKQMKIASFSDDGATSHTYTLTSEQVDEMYKEGVLSIEENNSSRDWENQTGGKFGLRGRIELKPEFGYIDAKVKINLPEGDFGYLKICGEDKDISTPQTFTYHLGDVLKISSVVRDEYSDLFTPAGYKVSYKYNESDTNWVKRDVIVPYTEDNGTSAYLDDNERLRYGYYEITPLFTRNDNALTLRVKKSDLPKFDISYGFFNSPVMSETTIDGEEYYEYVIESHPIYGEIYTLSVRMADDAGSSIYPVWKERYDDKLYGGEVFFHEASNVPENNIVTLSYVEESGEDIYQSVKGSVYMPSFNMMTRRAVSANAIPAKGAIVNIGGEFAAVEDDGSFTTAPFRAACNTEGSTARHYIRYKIELNGQSSLREMELPYVESEKREVVFANNETGSRVNRTVSVCEQNLGQLRINSENGSIINNIELTTDNPSQGSSLVIDGEEVSVTARMSEPVKYTKVEMDKYGNIIKTPNADESVTGVKFMIYDPDTNAEIASCEAEKNSDGSFTGYIPLEKAIPGYRLYMRVTTDKTHGINSEVSKQRKESAVSSSSNDDAMNTTTYSDVFTGYTFLQKTTEEVPVLQHIDIPADIDFISLPFVGTAAMRLDLPFVSVGSIKTPTGYRMYIGVSPVQIVDTVKDMHMNQYQGDTGTYYKDLFSARHPIQTFTDGITRAYNEAFNNMMNNSLPDAAAALGAPTWKVDVQAGIYFDFTYVNILNRTTGYNNNAAVFTGVGAYVGASVNVKRAHYTIIPVVYIPAYFGLELGAYLLGFFGAGTDTSKPEITYEDAHNATVDFQNKLGKSQASIQIAGTVQIYAGVGLAGTIGVRAGGTFTAMGVFEFTGQDPGYDSWGCDLVFTLGAWIDLFLFSIPLQYEFPDIKFGFFEQYETGPNLTSNTGDTALMSGEEQPSFGVRQPYSDEKSEWMPEGDISLMSAFGETSSTKLVENAYEHPDTQLIKLEDGSVFMAFLDSDASRGATERTVLKYAVYKDGTWSEPKDVQNDKKADFQPSVCEIGDGKVMISWLSSDPDKPTTEDSADYMRNLEVYTAVIDPATGTVSDETRLTDDEYYDYTPTCVYDEVTGDRIVYYVKTDSDGTAEEMSNSYTNGCAVVYMLYSKEKGNWMFDEYYDNEVASEEDRQYLLENWHGQRFLSSPLPLLGHNVPNISDFTATTYNGISVYAYTIDQDSSNDTTYDKEMFIQCYDFEQHKTYKPVRITDDNVSDALPQFVRTKGGEPPEELQEKGVTQAEMADTMLFWYRDEKYVTYIDISALVRDGVDEDGHIKEDYLKDPNGVDKELEDLYSYVSVPAENQDSARYMADFKAIADEGDIYVIWTQPETYEDSDGNAVQSREVYATALIRSDSASSDDEKDIGCGWASPYRLTHTKAFADEPNAVVDSKGNLMTLYNSFKQELTGDEKNPVRITDFNLMASYMEPCGAVDVTDIALSDETPNAGDTVNVSVSVKNNGLTYADGYKVNVYEAQNSQKQGEAVHTIESDNKLLPGNTDIYTFEWTVPEGGTDGMSFIAEAQEGGMTNTSAYESETLEEQPVYVVDNVDSYQDCDGYHVSYSVTNTGNAPSNAGDTMKVIFSGPYAMAAGLTPEECNWGSAEIGALDAGETASYKVDLDVISEKLDEVGFVDCLLIGEDSGGYVTQGENIRLLAAMPMEFMLNGGPFPEKIELAEGETMEFNITCEPNTLSEGMSAALGTDDAAVAAFDGTTLKALSEGTTVIHGNVTPYGNAIPDITVTVTPKPASRPRGSGSGAASRRDTATPAPTASPEPTATPEPTTEPDATPEPDSGNTAETQFKDVTPSDWFSGSVKYAAEKGYFAGVSEDTFEPDTNVTRGMLITVIGRMNGVKPENTDMTYTDVNKDMYYAPYIAWGTENGIVSGYSDTEFAPDELVTREQVAAMLWRYAQYIGKDVSVGENTNILSYADAAEANDYAVPAIQWACGSGIMSGYTDNTLRPQNNATRAEAAALTERFDKTIK